MRYQVHPGDDPNADKRARGHRVVAADPRAPERRGPEDPNKDEVPKLPVAGTHLPRPHQMSSAAAASATTIPARASVRPPEPAPCRRTCATASAGSVSAVAVGSGVATSSDSALGSSGSTAAGGAAPSSISKTMTGVV